MIEAGTIWRHYKGGVYVSLGDADRVLDWEWSGNAKEDYGAVMVGEVVAYRRVSDGRVFARPVSEWTEVVVSERHHGAPVLRFVTFDPNAEAARMAEAMRLMHRRAQAAESKAAAYERLKASAVFALRVAVDPTPVAVRNGHVLTNLDGPGNAVCRSPHEIPYLLAEWLVRAQRKRTPDLCARRERARKARQMDRAGGGT